MPSSTTTLFLTLTAPNPAPVPDGAPPARPVSLDIADSSGRLCGTLQFADVALGFEVGERDDPPMIENPASEMGDWTAWPDLSSVLPDGVNPDLYVDYLRQVIRTADEAYRQVVGRALKESAAHLLSSLTPATAPATEPAQVGEPDEYVYSHCGCGSEIVFTPEGWQHNSAPWFWGDDHDAEPDFVSDEDEARMDAYIDKYESELSGNDQ